MTASTRTTAASSLEHGEGFDILDSVRSALSATGYRTVAGLSCQVVDHVIIISGVVSSFYLKQVAQQAVLKYKKSYVIRNVVEVRSQKRRDERHQV